MPQGMEENLLWMITVYKNSEDPEKAPITPNVRWNMENTNGEYVAEAVWVLYDELDDKLANEICGLE